jgi:hypothetical protein
MKGRSHRRNEARVLADLESGRARRTRPWPTTVLWRWRYEVSLVVLVPIGFMGFVRGLGPGATAAAAVVVLGSVAVDPALRRALARRAWCVITPHRLRVGCVEARIHSRKGRLPAILLTRPIPDGERVLLWCPAGTSAEDFWSARISLRAACWAQDIRVTAHRRHAHLVTVDVIRAGIPTSPTAPPRPDSTDSTRARRRQTGPSHDGWRVERRRGKAASRQRNPAGMRSTLRAGE